MNDPNPGYPDYTNVLTEIAAQGASWTATQNCYIIGIISQAANQLGAEVAIDGVGIGSIYVGDKNASKTTVCVPVAQGQTVTTGTKSGNSYNLKAYGLLRISK